MKQFVIIQNELAVAVTGYTEEEENAIIIEPEDFSKVLSAPKGVYLKPQRLKIVGNYAIIEQKERGS
ncbi:MAG TPA: hypothetical protein G4N96_10415 [Chloroflexi bacterium]|nr:hypothetical protein [Chloroflexota bacterium]